MEYFEDGTTHDNLDGLFDGIPMGREYITVLTYSVGASVGSSKESKYDNLDDGVDGKLNMSVIRFILLAPMIIYKLQCWKLN